jgi:hypothetical protein
MNSLVWTPKKLCSLFDVDWDTTQLKAILTDLDIPSECTISGGAIVRTLLKEDIFKGDIDIFAHTKRGLEQAIDQYGKDKSWTKAKHAWNFDYNMGVRKTKVQVITKEEPSIVGTTLHKFDFEHCKFALLGTNINGSMKRSIPDKEPTFVSTMSSPTILAQKTLRLGLIRDPNYSLGRAIKYKRMGFDADKAIEQLVGMSMKGMKDIQCCADDYSSPLSVFEIDEAIATASS